MHSHRFIKYFGQALNWEFFVMQSGLTALAGDRPKYEVQKTHHSCLDVK